jgi:phage FluMu protein Com
MPIQIVCPECNSVLQVNEKLAGKKGKCPKCTAVVAIPGTDCTHMPYTERLLRDASPREMVGELFRRRKSAVLALYDSPAASSYKLTELPNTKVDCLGTEDMDVGQLRQVLKDLAKLAGSDNSGGMGMETEDGDQLYELKGEQLGMSLADFKIKHARHVEGESISLPWCSDSTPGRVIEDLYTEIWHAKAGIVHGRIDLPCEANSPTIAGVDTERILYQFVEDQLFRITAFFDTEQFHVIRECIIKKYGPPREESSQPTEMIWRNRRSTIKLLRGTVRPKRASLLHFIHDELMQTAEQKKPKQEDDL